jgi:hypothetical protein
MLYVYRSSNISNSKMVKKRDYLLPLMISSILDNLEKRISIIINNSSEPEYIEVFNKIQNLSPSMKNISEIICICPNNDSGKKEPLSVYEVFALLKSYPFISYWIFSDIGLIIDNSKPFLGDCMQKYNLDLNIKALVMNNSSVGLLQTLLCEKRITKHIELLEITQHFKNPSDNINFVLPQMENLRVLVIQATSADLVMNLFIKSYKTFMDLDTLTIDSWLCVPDNCMPDFTDAFLTVLTKVQKKVSLRWVFLYNILACIETNETSPNLDMQAQTLTLDLSLYLPTQDVILPNSDRLCSQLQKSIKILFKQNVSEYVFTTSECFLNYQNISMKQFEDLIEESYNAVKDQRQRPDIQVEYTD